MDASDSDGGGRPVLCQRFAPWLAVRTTVHDRGLVIEVRRLFSERMATIDFDRLVLEPGSARGVRRGLLWLAGGWFAAGLAASSAPAIPFLVAPCLFVMAVLTVLGAVVDPQRVTVFLDREGALNPMFLRGGPDEDEAAAFVETVLRAGIAWRCDPAPPEESEEAPSGPRLADTLDRLLDLRSRALLSDAEFETFQEIALRR